MQHKLGLASSTDPMHNRDTRFLFVGGKGSVKLELYLLSETPSIDIGRYGTQGIVGV